jgi:hypothetical protein
MRPLAVHYPSQFGDRIANKQLSHHISSDHIAKGDQHHEEWSNRLSSAIVEHYHMECRRSKILAKLTVVACQVWSHEHGYLALSLFAL